MILFEAKKIAADVLANKTNSHVQAAQILSNFILEQSELESVIKLALRNAIEDTKDCPFCKGPVSALQPTFHHFETCPILTIVSLKGEIR